jgi:hypothetical protein
MIGFPASRIGSAQEERAVKPMRPFIPRWFDELDLPPTHRRVLQHLWSRANRACECWPSVRSISEVCDVNRDTVWAALKHFESAGLMSRSKRTRNSNKYRMLIPLGVGGTIPLTEHEELADPVGQQLAERPGQQLADPVGQQLAEPVRHKGILREVSPKEGLPSEGEGRTLANLPQSLSEFELQALAVKLGVRGSDVAAMYAEVRRIKIGFPKDWQFLQRTDIPGWVQTFLEADSRGRKLMAAVRPPAPARVQDYSRI